MCYSYFVVLKEREKGENMLNNKKVERYLWISAVMFLTYLLLSSFIVSKNFLELGYLIMLYMFLLVAKIKNKDK